MRSLRLLLFVLSFVVAMPSVVATTSPGDKGSALLPRIAFSGEDRQMTDWWFRQHAGAIKQWYDPVGKLPPRIDRELAPNDRLPKALPKAYLPWGLERLLSPLPPDLERVIVGHHVVLVERRTATVLDVMREVVR